MTPDLNIRVDDADAFARVIATELPYWPAPDRGGLRHQWALWSEGTTKLEPLLVLECPSCREKFSPTKCTGGWVCMCPQCTVDAASADDGGMPPCGQGATLFEAAQDWWEMQ